MPGTVGDDSIATKGAIEITAAEAQIQHATGTYVVASGDDSIEFFIHCDTGTSGSLTIGLHNLSDAGALVASSSVSCSGSGRHTASISGAALAGIVGDTIVASIGGLSGTIWGFREYQDNAADTEDSAIMSDAIADPFTVGSGFNQTYAFGAVITASGGGGGAQAPRSHNQHSRRRAA